jgi:hypothetical protein
MPIAQSRRSSQMWWDNVHKVLRSVLVLNVGGLEHASWAEEKQTKVSPLAQSVHALLSSEGVRSSLPRDEPLVERCHDRLFHALEEGRRAVTSRL